MAATNSNMPSLYTEYYPFTLPNATEKGNYTLDAKNHPNGFVVIFMCNHCPFVIHILDKFIEIAHSTEKIGFVAVSSNDVVKFPEDSFDNMKKLAEKKGFKFPYVYDAEQIVAKAYDAACTPDIFVFDGQGQLFYRGQFDETRPMQGEPTGKDLKNALNKLIMGEKAPTEQTPSIGCGIKWIK